VGNFRLNGNTKIVLYLTLSKLTRNPNLIALSIWLPGIYILIYMLQRSNLFIEIEYNLKSLAPEEPPVIWSRC
jgi:hypothetical protein